AASDHDVVGFDASLVGDDRLHPPVLHLDVEHLGVGEDREGTHVLCPLAHDRAGAQRVDDRHRGGVEAAQDHRLLDERHELLHLARGQQGGLDAPGLRRAHPAAQLLHPLFGARHLDPAAGGVDSHLLVLPLRLESQRGQLLAVVDGEDEVGSVARGSPRIGKRSLVDLDDVVPPLLGEVERNGVADDAGPDDDYSCARWKLTHLRTLRRLRSHDTERFCNAARRLQAPSPACHSERLFEPLDNQVRAIYRSDIRHRSVSWNLLNRSAAQMSEEEIDLSALSDEELVEQMHDDLYDGLADEIVEGTNILLERGWDPNRVLNEALVEGMRIVGIDFRDGILFVPEVLLAANAMKAGMAVLRPLLAETGAPTIGKVVIGTVKGDIHDIGKNLVGMMLEGAGFEVVD